MVLVHFLQHYLELFMVSFSLRFLSGQVAIDGVYSLGDLMNQNVGFFLSEILVDFNFSLQNGEFVLHALQGVREPQLLGLLLALNLLQNGADILLELLAAFGFLVEDNFFLLIS